LRELTSREGRDEATDAINCVQSDRLRAHEQRKLLDVMPGVFEVASADLAWVLAASAEIRAEVGDLSVVPRQDSDSSGARIERSRNGAFHEKLGAAKATLCLAALDPKLRRSPAGSAPSFEACPNCEQPPRQFRVPVPPMRGLERQNLIAFRQVACEPLTAGTAELVDELHRVGKHNQAITAELTNDSILQRRSVLMLVSNDHGIARPVSLINCREALEQRPEERAKIIENEPTCPLFPFNDGDRARQCLRIRCSGILELRKCVLSNRLGQAFAAAQFPYEPCIFALECLHPPAATADIQPHREPECSPVGEHRVPKEAVVVGDLHATTEVRG
jgi:hypothetical protein